MNFTVIKRNDLITYESNTHIIRYNSSTSVYEVLNIMGVDDAVIEESLSFFKEIIQTILLNS